MPKRQKTTVADQLYQPEGSPDDFQADLEREELRWNILAEVWGGVTGHRTGLLKHNGVVEEFASREAAAAKAAELTRQMNGPNRVANFRYLVVSTIFGGAQ